MKPNDLSGVPAGTHTRSSPHLRDGASVDVAVIGAGVVGMSIAWRLACRGLDVAVLDRGAAGGGTSRAATGMLAAAAEVEPGGEALARLCLESQRLWPGFRDALESEAGRSIDFRDEGTMLVALGRDEVERLRFRHELQTAAGLETRWLGGGELREREPGLRATATAGILCPNDHQVDPPLLIDALGRALAGRGAIVHEHCAVTGIETTGGRVSGVRTETGVLRAATVVLATGVWAGSENLLPVPARIPVRPLKGQALALRMPNPPALSHVVWTENVHLAPKSDGRLIVGATVEESGFDDRVTAGGVYALLEGARRALPSIEEMELVAAWTGWRPTSDDDSPVLGETSVPGVVVATGHHRNGYLLAPVTAEAIAGLVAGDGLPDLAADFTMARFGRPHRNREIHGATA